MLWVHENRFSMLNGHFGSRSKRVHSFISIYLHFNYIQFIYYHAQQHTKYCLFLNLGSILTTPVGLKMAMNKMPFNKPLIMKLKLED